jgi:hypothetical protein
VTAPTFLSNQAITITIASLGINTAVASSAIDNSTAKHHEALVQVKIKTNAAGTSATGLVNVFLVRSADNGTTYDDNNKVLLGSLPAIANGTTYIATFSTLPYGALGTHWKIAVENRSGAALSATAGDHSATFTGVDY